MELQLCTEEFHRLASEVGGLDCDGNAFLTLTSPFELDNWTMPVIEATLIIGAIACLVHAFKWKKQYDDPSNLVVWFAGFFTLFLVEPFTYFPQWFGIDEFLGLTFVHNQFSIQFFYNRLPLYIMGMYPVFTYLGYALVQRAGIFYKYPSYIGAICVGMAFHFFYETVDMIGAQHRWWVWNDNLPLLEPYFGIVPIICMQAFAFAFPAGVAWLSYLTSGPNQSNPRLAGNIIVSALATYIVVFALVTAPYLLLNLFGLSVETARIVSYCIIISGATLITLNAFYKVYLARKNNEIGLPSSMLRDKFPLICSIVYMIVVAILWAVALQDYFAAENGRTPSGAPIGILPYSLATAILAIMLLFLVYKEPTRKP